MESLLTHQNFEGILALLLIFGGGFLVAIVAIVANAISSWKRTEREVDLKHRMLDAGMSAADIERVLNAGRPGTKCD
jgi:hypothetical protein